MVKVSAQTPLLICCYFPCTRQADTGVSKKERQFCNCPPWFCQFGRSMNGRGCLFRSLCPSCRFLLFVLPQSFPRHSSSVCAMLGSKFTCQAEKTTYYHTSTGHLCPQSYYIHYLVTCLPSSVWSTWHLPLERHSQATELSSQVAAPSTAITIKGTTLTLLAAGPSMQRKF